MSEPVRLDPAARRVLEQHGIEAYPHECCGALYADADGASHFRDIEVEWTREGPGGRMSATQKATGIIFRETSSDYDLDWHPAPRRQYIVNLDGAVQITASDGESRIIGAAEAFSSMTADRPWRLAVMIAAPLALWAAGSLLVASLNQRRIETVSHRLTGDRPALGVELACPLAGQERDDLRAALQELRTVTPDAVFRVGQ